MHDSFSIRDEDYELNNDVGMFFMIIPLYLNANQFFMKWCDLLSTPTYLNKKFIDALGIELIQEHLSDKKKIHSKFCYKIYCIKFFL